MRRKVCLTTLALLTLSGCELLVGTDERVVDPLVDGCELPDRGDARIRFANLLPDTAAVDVCVRPHGGSYHRSVLRGSGSTCAAGYRYKDVSAPFAVASGAIDVKIIDSGQRCTAPARAEISNVPIARDAVVTIARAGSKQKAEQLLALPEEATPTGSNLRVRFVNTIFGSTPLYLGLTADTTLPTEVSFRMLKRSVPFGATPKVGDDVEAGAVDDRGYWVLPPLRYQLGAAPEGATKALLAQTFAERAATFTLYAIGDMRDNGYPMRGLLCDESAPATASTMACVETALPTLAIDTYNVGLYGAAAPYEGARRQAIYEAVAERDSDFQCIVEAARQSDREAIAKAAKDSGNFPYAYWPTTDVTTPVTEPTDQQGKIPAEPRAAPCRGTNDPSAVEAGYACLEDKCTTTPNDPKGRLSGGVSCMSSRCGNALAPLIAGSDDAKSCFACIVDTLTDDGTYGDSRTRCTTDPRRPLAFRGETPSLILSRHPLENTDAFILPSTNFRRAVLYAQAKLDEGTTIDFFCAQLSSPLINRDLPYTGAYGDGDASHGYDREALLQTQKLIEWVRSKKSPDRQAIIAGDFHASLAAGSIAELNPGVIRALDQAFQRAEPEPFRPQCTYCPAPINTYNGAVSEYVFESTYLWRWPDKATVEKTVIHNRPLIPGVVEGLGMLSPSFGLHVRVIRP